MRFASQLALSSALVSSLALFAAACTEKKTESAPAPAAAKPAAASAARALEVPRDRIWAASAHVRVIDTAAGQVVGGIQLQKAIDDITFTADGHRAFIAASDGVRVVDVDELKIVAQLTTSPARQVLLSPDGKTLGVLEHDVNVAPNGVRTPSPFRWKTIDVDGAKVVKEEVVGDRVLGVIPGYGVRSSAIMFESGDIGLVPAGKPLLGGSVAIDLERGVEATAKAILMPRPY